MTRAEMEFLEMVLRNSKIRAILDRAGELHLPDWWLTGGAVFQTVWNALEGRPAEAGILDYDLFYFDGDDLTAESEATGNRAATALFADLGIDVEARNEAIYAPHGFDDLVQRRVRANPVLVPRSVYESKARRWSTQWPSLTLKPWPRLTLEASDFMRTAPPRGPTPRPTGS